MTRSTKFSNQSGPFKAPICRVWLELSDSCLSSPFRCLNRPNLNSVQIGFFAFHMIHSLDHWLSLAHGGPSLNRRLPPPFSNFPRPLLLRLYRQHCLDPSPSLAVIIAAFHGCFHQQLLGVHGLLPHASPSVVHCLLLSSHPPAFHVPSPAAFLQPSTGSHSLAAFL